MAWWTEKIIQRHDSENAKPKGTQKLSDVLCRVSNICTKEDLLDLIYFWLNIFAYGYLLLIIVVFFFQPHIPKFIISIVGTLSEPYLGALGIYFVLKEVMRARGFHISNRTGEVFFVTWVVLLIVSSALTYFSQTFHFDRVYNLIITDSLAALIIRIGLFLK